MENRERADGDDRSDPRSVSGSSAPRLPPEYRFVRFLGEGAMGSVVLAEQLAPIKRQVAVKVLRPGRRSSRAIHRFELERRALARMNHPSVAQIYDAGETDAGEPYVVMELVDGAPVTDFADAHRLDVKQRLALFAEACRGLHHAHLRGILHRDVKPSNVLVTDTEQGPRAKVIDFGIAKALDESESFAGSEGLTIDGVVGTPVYISPECFSELADDLDVRADVYALGVLLFDLLIGATPLGRTGESLLRYATRLAEEEPAAPSQRFRERPEEGRLALARDRRTSPAALARLLRGDLDRIALRAVEKDRSRRYGSAAELADDVERFFRHEPVRAVPPGGLYLLRKFVRRHWTSVTAGLLFVAALLAGIVAVTLESRQTERARRASEIARGQAEDLVGFMLEDLHGSLEPLGETALLGRVAARVEDYYRQLAPEHRDDRPERQVRALRHAGEVFLRRGELPAAAQALEEGREYGLTRLELQPERNDLRVELSRTLAALGQVRKSQGDWPQAEELLRPAVELQRDAVERSGGELELRSGLADVLDTLGGIQGRRRLHDASFASFLSALDIRRALVAAMVDRLDWRYGLAVSLDRVGDAYKRRRLLSEAMDAYSQGLDLLSDLVKQEPNNIEWRHALAVAWDNVGDVHLAQGRAEAALAAYEEDLEISLELAEKDPGNVRRVVALTYAWAGVAEGQEVLGRHEAALRSLDEGIALCRRHRIDAATSVDWAGRAARLLTRSGRLRRVLGRIEPAHDDLQEAIELRQGLLEVDPENVIWRHGLARAEIELGRLLAATGHDGEAREAIERGLAAIDPLLGEDASLSLVATAATGLVLLGRTEEVMPWLARLEKAKWFNDPGHADLLSLGRERGLIASS